MARLLRAGQIYTLIVPYICQFSFTVPIISILFFDAVRSEHESVSTTSFKFPNPRHSKLPCHVYWDSSCLRMPGVLQRVEALYRQLVLDVRHRSIPQF